MQILITTDSSRSTDAQLVKHVSDSVASALADVAEHITYAEVHLSEEHAAAEGNPESRCLIEARLRGRQPMLVIHQATSVDKALAGALKNLLKVIDSAFARHHEQFNRHAHVNRHVHANSWSATHE